jgi:hypothetical protein
LERRAGTWLDQVHDALPKLLDRSVDFDAWLDWSDPERRSLGVHVGEQRVGVLDEDAMTAFSPVMTAADQRDELPYTTARLTRRPNAEYLLELGLPTPSEQP